MPDEVANNLLDSIPTGEVVKDLREGEHYEAKLNEAELIEQSNGPAIRVTYTGCVDADGREFSYQERYTIPTSNSEDFIQRLFLAAAHAWGLVPPGDNRRILADTPEAREAILNAVRSVQGSVVPLKLTTGKTGYLQSRFLRKRG